MPRIESMLGEALPASERQRVDDAIHTGLADASMPRSSNSTALAAP
jgi:hypothetical protein